MSIVKQLLGGKKYRLPEVSAAHECRLPLLTAYVCFECESIQDKAGAEVCRACGSKDLHSVSQAFVQQQNRALQRIDEAQARKRQRMRLSLAIPPTEAMAQNAGRYLTERELGQDEGEK